MKTFTLFVAAMAALCGSVSAQNRVRNIYTSFGDLNTDLFKAENPSVQLNRTLLAGYNTLCLPMSLSAEALAEAAKDVQIEKLAAVKQEGSTLYMYFLDCTKEGIEAGVPYLIFSPTTQTLKARTSEAKNVSTDLKSVTMSDNAGNQVTFGSSWEALKVHGRYGIPAQQDVNILESVLIRTEADKTFLPTRCGFTWDKQAATATRLEIKHVTDLNGGTAIETLKTENAVVDVYSVSGSLVKPSVRINEALRNLPAGIYVIGGEKVAVK